MGRFSLPNMFMYFNLISQESEKTVFLKISKFIQSQVQCTIAAVTLKFRRLVDEQQSS